MILPKSNRLTPGQVAEVTAIVAEFGCKLQPIVGAVRTIYAIVGDERDDLMINRLEGLDYIDRIDRIQSPFKLMDRRSDLATHRIKLGGVTLGEELLVIAGPCTIDPKNPNYFYETAAAAKEAGAQVIRGGVWKPRTNPYSFQGDDKSLEILMEGHRRTGLPVDAEVMDETQLAMALKAGVHMLQVGARNALNYSLLRAIGKAVADRKTVVLLKRSLHMGPLSEFISAAEYIAAFGNPNVILCPRGTAPAPDGYRSHPDECITPLLKEKTWAPVVVDPSHSVGKATYVPAAALAAVAYGADGLCIEAHVSPSHGIGDDPKQALTPAALAETIAQAKQVWSVRRPPREAGEESGLTDVASCGYMGAVKAKKRNPSVYPTAKDTAAQIREDAVAYGLRRDVLGVREAKDQLSSLLQRAAAGEEIVITSDGEPTAMIVRYRPVLRGKPFKPHWELLKSMPMTSDSAKLVRRMRDDGY